MITVLIKLTVLLTMVKITATFSCPPLVKAVCSCTTTFVGEFHKKERNFVDCSSRELYEVPVLDFAKGSRIFRLWLRNNTLLAISPSVFVHKTHIEHLDISNNPLGNTLQDGLFGNNILKLKTVDASEIGLNLNLQHSLSFLKGLSSLKELDLSRNHEYAIATLPDLFYDKEIYGLQKLRLALCRIEDISEGAFDGLNDIRELDLSQNFLSVVPKAINRLSLLRKLSLRENDITVIHRGAFRGLRCLEELDISINLLGQMEAFANGAFIGIGNSLRTLALQDAHLAFIPTLALSELTKLKNLDLSYNRIIFMNNRSFHGEYRLESLDISGNPWLIEDDMFHCMQDSLVSLALRKIGLTFLPRTPLSKLKRLRFLDASYNDLKFISNGSFAGLRARTLILHGNNIEYISPYAFNGYERPIDVDVSGNEIKSLDFVFKSPMCTFFKLNISDNSLPCDCQIEQLVNSLRVKRLSGDCVSSGENVYSIADENLAADLQRRCGKSEPTHCFWWLPKSSGTSSISNIYAHMYIYLASVLFFTYS